MRIGILTGGGDCPGLNAVIRAVVRKGIGVHGDEIVGFRDGWRGAIEGDTVPLDLTAVRGILPRGGTVLGTSRTNPYAIDGGADRVLATLDRLGIDALIPIGGEDTHEFLVLAETGESEVFYDNQITDLTFGDRQIDYDDHAACAAVLEEFTSRYARTDETHEEAVFAEVPEERRRTARGIEVGQIFYFGTKYSEPMGATVVGPDGSRTPVHMGSHGIGVSRLLGAIIEASHDDKGIIWPEGVTPFHVGLVNLKQGDPSTDSACEALERELSARGLEGLYDDRDERAGAKFATMDLIGLPWRITVGPRGLANNVVELTNRRTGESVEISASEAVSRLSDI